MYSMVLFLETEVPGPQTSSHLFQLGLDPTLSHEPLLPLPSPAQCMAFGGHSTNI